MCGTETQICECVKHSIGQHLQHDIRERHLCLTPQNCERLYRLQPFDL